MVFIVCIFIIGLTPAIISAYMSLRADHKIYTPSSSSSRLSQGLRPLSTGGGDPHYVEGVGYMIGDITCDLNARSPHLRCAVNPVGPCDGCREYAPKVFDRHV